MINKILEKIAGLALGGRLLAGVTWAHDKLDGHKSEIIAALALGVHALKLAGVLDATIAATAETALLGALAPALSARIKKVTDTADRIIPEAPKA